MSLLNETDEDLQLPQRGADRRSMGESHMRHDGVRERSHEPEREFTLSTGTVLALFFALALVCAVFFGFGYTMGRKSVQSAAETASSAPASDTNSEPSAASKPSAGSPATQAIPGYLSQGEADGVNRSAGSPGSKASSVTNSSGTTVTIPTKPARTAAPDPGTRPAALQTSSGTSATEATPVRTPTSSPAHAVPIVIPPSTPVPAAAGAGPNYVQIAAVSHAEDADVLLSALKRRGYSVFTRSGDGDKLIHVQVGPFATKKDAEAMRQKLLGDGYNAILK